MALQGLLETADGIIHNDAYGFVYPLVITTYPIPNAKFDFHIWHNQTAFESGKTKIKVVTFEIEGQELLNFMSSTEESIKNGMSLIDATISTMQSYIKEKPLFQDWIFV